MRRSTRLALWFAVPLALLAGGLWALHAWVNGPDVRERLAAEASALLGAPVRAEGLSLALWPLPGVAVDGLQVQARTPLTLQRVALRPRWGALLRGRLRVQTLVVREAVLPEATVALITRALDDPARRAPGPPAEEGIDFDLLPRELRLDQVTWLAADGARTTLDADLRFDADGWPASAEGRITAGAHRGARWRLQRDGGATAWRVDAALGGGTVRGPLVITAPAAGEREPRVRLQGHLQTAGVEVSALTAPSRALSGRLQARTELSARFPVRASADDLVRALRTETTFNVSEAVVHGVDLAKAVTTVGLSRGGETALDTLTGRVVTRGRAIDLSELKATSGVLAATGEVSVSPARALSGRVRVDMTRGAGGGAVGVPLAVGGTLDEPQLTLTRSALLGAAIGTAVLPGVGTGAGANLGERIGEGIQGLFGGGEGAAPRR